MVRKRARSEDEATGGFAAGAAEAGRAAAHEALEQAPAAADPFQRRPGGKDNRDKGGKDKRLKAGGEESRDKDEAPESSAGGKQDTGDGAAAAGKKASWKKRQPCTVFMNQVPYTCGEEVIRAFVCSAPGVARDDVVGIRMVNDPATRMFKGICFVEMSSEAKRDAVLSLHRSALEGRAVNVTECQDKDEVAKRRAASAASAAEGSLSPEQLAELFEQACTKFSVAQRRTYRLSPADFDAGINKFLGGCSAETVKAALHEFAVHDTQHKLVNKNSFLMGIIKKYRFPDAGAGAGAGAGDKASGVGGKASGTASGKASGKTPLAQVRGPAANRAAGELLTQEQVSQIVALSAAPRRAKKSEAGGRAPDASLEEGEARWAAFSPVALAAMRKMLEPELKRTLSAFFKSPELGAAADKSAMFLKLASRAEGKPQGKPQAAGRPKAAARGRPSGPGLRGASLRGASQRGASQRGAGQRGAGGAPQRGERRPRPEDAEHPAAKHQRTADGAGRGGGGGRGGGRGHGRGRGRGGGGGRGGR